MIADLKEDSVNAGRSKDQNPHRLGYQGFDIDLTKEIAKQHFLTVSRELRQQPRSLAPRTLAASSGFVGD